MTVELIISLVSLVLSTACSMMTVFVTLRVGKLNNLEAIHKYQKKITIDELQFKTKEWFLNIMANDEFGNYERNSQVIMLAWYKKLCAEDNSKEQENDVRALRLSYKQPDIITKTRKTGRGNITRVPNLPKQGGMFSTGIPVEVVLPGAENQTKVRSTETLEELRNQYSADNNNDTIIKEVELSFDDLLAANLEIKEDQ